MPDIKSLLQQSKDALGKAILDKKRNEEIIKSLGPAIIDVLKPILNEIVVNSKLSKNEILSALSNIKVDVPKIDVPHAQVDVKIPEIKVPTPQVTVNIPDIKIPEFKEIKLPKISVPKPEVIVNFDTSKIKMPTEMDVKGSVNLEGIDLRNPLPVQLRDSSGNAINLMENLTQVISSGGGARTGKFSVNQLDIHTVSDGNRTVTAGTALPLITASTPCKKLTVTALPNNTDLIVVGGQTVVASSDNRRGHTLFAGSAITLEIDNVNKIFIDSIVTGEGVSFIYLN